MGLPSFLRCIEMQMTPRRRRPATQQPAMMPMSAPVPMPPVAEPAEPAVTAVTVTVIAGVERKAAVAAAVEVRVLIEVWPASASAAEV